MRKVTVTLDEYQWEQAMRDARLTREAGHKGWTVYDSIRAALRAGIGDMVEQNDDAESRSA